MSYRLMKVLVPLLFLAVLMKNSPAFSQSLQSLRWEKRVVLILTEDESDPIFKAQLAEFEEDAGGMDDRKLQVFVLQPDRYKSVFPKQTSWQSPSRYQKMRKGKGPLEVMLIGLDGGVKLRRNELFTRQELFDLIDSMPMRMWEMKQKTPSSGGG